MIVLAWRGYGLIVPIVLVIAVMISSGLRPQIGSWPSYIIAVLFAAGAIHFANLYLLKPRRPEDKWHDTFFLAPVAWWPWIIMGVPAVGFAIGRIAKLIIYVLYS